LAGESGNPKMVAKFKNKRRSITRIRAQYLSFATFPTPLFFHWSVSLTGLCVEMNIFWRLIIIKRYFFVHALIDFTILCCLVDEKSNSKKF
jgi:hypothetical protein